MMYVIRILPNGDGRWFIAGYDPTAFTVGMGDTYEEALEYATEWAAMAGYTVLPAGDVVPLPDRGAA